MHWGPTRLNACGDDCIGQNDLGFNDGSHQAQSIEQRDHGGAQLPGGVLQDRWGRGAGGMGGNRRLLQQTLHATASGRRPQTAGMQAAQNSGAAQRMAQHSTAQHSTAQHSAEQGSLA